MAVFNHNRFWQVLMEYWKGSQHIRFIQYEGMAGIIRIRVIRKPRSATCPIDTWQIEKVYRAD